MFKNNASRYKAGFVKQVSVFLMCFVMLILICNPGYAYNEINIKSAGFETAAENDDLILYFNAESGSISVMDKSNNYIWSSVVDDNIYDMTDVNKTWIVYMTSPVVIRYVNIEKRGSSIRKNYSSKDASVSKIQMIKNGLEIEYDFSKVGIKLAVEYLLNGKGLVVRIPSEKIVETTNNGLKEIELMPFFGAADHNTDGYIMYPDGSGAISKYENALKRPAGIGEYTMDVYSPLVVDLDKRREMTEKNIYNATLPVYGIKNGENAVLSAIVKDGYNANIRVSPEGQAVDLNRVNFNFTYRHNYELKMSDISVNGAGVSKNPSVIYTDKEIINQSPEINFFFLQNDEANYSGMANAYRNFLIESNSINKVIDKDDNVPMGLDLFMGIKEKRIIFSRFITNTTFKNAISIADEFIENGVDSMQIMLKGWTKGGYGKNPVYWPPERRLGGKKGLGDLLEYVNENQLQLFLHNDFTSADKENRGYSKKNDTVLQGSKLVVTDYSNSNFLLNPQTAFKKLNGLLDSLKKFKGAGMAFDSIGSYIYHDYNKSNPFRRAETAKKWKDMTNNVSEDERSVAAGGGNLYLLENADRIYEVPIKDSGDYITDEAIPFYQMVVHGMIPYSSDPGNLSYDFNYTRLKWVEYGCMPYFELTYQNFSKLKDTDYNSLFTSYYGDWTDEIVSIYKEFNQRLKSIWSQKMITHEKLGEGLYYIEYGNGTIVYINYNKEKVIHNELTINAQDYLVVEKGGVFK